jgi:hypothetical protein
MTPPLPRNDGLDEPQQSDRPSGKTIKNATSRSALKIVEPNTLANTRNSKVIRRGTLAVNRKEHVLIPDSVYSTLFGSPGMGGKPAQTH